MKNAQTAAYEHALRLEYLGDSRLSADFYRIFNWPALINGTAHDRTVIIEEFADGSTGIYLCADALGFKARLLQLRAMANPG